MSGWLAGLGAGMQQVGGELMDMNKRQMAEKLAREREDRAEERQMARENRALQRENAKVADTQVDVNSGMKRYFNANGDLLKEEPATAFELDSLKLAQQKEQAGLAKILADTRYSEVRADSAAGRSGLELELLGARVDSTRASAEASRASAVSARAAAARANAATAEASKTPTQEAAIGSLMKETENMIKGTNMSSRDQYALAQRAIEQAENQRKQGRNVDPLRLMRVWITNMAETKD